MSQKHERGVGGTGETPANTADSAGTPWAGRDLKPNPFSGDTGEADRELLDALAAVHANPFEPALHQKVIGALREKRVYAPVLPTAVEHTTDERGLVHDNKSEMAMVRLAAADGRECTPAFTGIPALTAWHAQARPVPTQAERLGAAAVEEGAQLVVLDPGSDRAFLIRRPALWAWLQGQEWTPAWANPQVVNAVAQVAGRHSWIESVAVGVGSANVVTSGPEVSLTVRVNREPQPEEVQAFNAELSQTEQVVELVDSLTMSFTDAQRA